MNRPLSRASLTAFACLSLVTPAALAQPAPAQPNDDEQALEEATDDDQGAPDEEGRQKSAPATDPDPTSDQELLDDEAALDDPALDAEPSQDAGSLSKPPAKGKAAIWGVIKDDEGETLAEAQISIVGTRFKTIADLDGRFRLELPPGTYSVRVYYELFRPVVVKDLTVAAGDVERVDVELLPDEAATDVVEIEAEADRSTLEGQMLTRQRASAVGDGVGRAEISRTPAGNAAQAAQRVVGATIVNNRFVYVRGLGERYTNAQLNGAPLPSPEPDRAAIPLDLFPSLILESVTIVKTFTPDVPGDFAGGSVRIQTRDLPAKPLLQLSAGLGYDTSSTFRDRLSHKGSNTDFLGFDGGTRQLPDGFPSYVLNPGDQKPDGSPITQDDLLAAGRELNSSMSPTHSFTPPNHSLSVVAGRGWSLGGEQRFGAVASLNYSRSFQVRDDVTLRTFITAPEVDPATGEQRTTLKPSRDLTAQVGVDKVNWGALASVSYWPAQRHRLTLLGMHTQLADATTQFTQGFFDDRATDIASVRMSYVTRALNVAQLRGEHSFPSLNKAELDWNLAYSVASRLEPDTRNTVYGFNIDQQRWNVVNTPENGSHLFADQGETSLGGGLDWTQPLLADQEVLKAKLGGLVSARQRDFEARRFVYSTVRGTPAELISCAGQDYDLSCPDKLYLYDNVGPVLSFNEATFPEDAYEAELGIYAGYAMLDANISDVRLIGGARVERTDQRITPISQFASGEGAPEGAAIESTDVLPSLSLTYSATDETKLRAAVTRTIARPQIRELSPYSFTNYFGGRTSAGNPDLELTNITNADLRFEAFPTAREVLAFSFFFKSFDKPIEPVIVPSGDGILSYQNADGATLVGLEVEARKSLEFLASALRDLSVIGNLTLAHSQIQLDTANTSILNAVTNVDRAMVNQAPYVVNLSLDYDHEPSKLGLRLLYNVVGPRIVAVGTAGLDDSFEQPRHTLDASASKGFGQHFQLKLNATNLLDSPVKVTIGKEDRDARVAEEWKEGRVFTLSGTYSY